MAHNCRDQARDVMWIGFGRRRPVQVAQRLRCDWADRDGGDISKRKRQTGSLSGFSQMQNA